MKKCTFFTAILFCANSLFAQAPQGINYQAAIRTAVRLIKLSVRNN
jgi:hypothetical protein